MREIYGVTEKIKVCHICNLGMNGKAVFVANLLENTDYSKYDVTILNFRNEHAEPVVDRLKKLPVKIVDIPKGGLYQFLKFENNYMKDNYFDVVHSHIWDLSALFLFVAKIRGVKVRVIHSHNTSKESRRYNVIKSFVRDTILWNLTKVLMKISANRYAGCSEEACKWLFPKSVIKTKNYSVILNGIDLKRFESKSKEMCRISPEILFSGRFIYQKNPVFAVQIFGELLKRIPQAHMTMVGCGVMDIEVENEINKLNLKESITIVPQTNEMEIFYKNADLFLFPSHYEGLGIVLIEAQAAGTLCLASNTVPVLSQCGLVKYLSLSEGASSWANEICKLLQDHEMKIDKNKLEAFSIIETVKQVDILYSYK